MTTDEHYQDAFPLSALDLPLTAKGMTANDRETFGGGVAVSLALG